LSGSFCFAKRDTAIMTKFRLFAHWVLQLNTTFVTITFHDNYTKLYTYLIKTSNNSTYEHIGCNIYWRAIYG